MNRHIGVAVAVFLVAFGAITLLKVDSAPDDGHASAIAPTDVDREAVTRFWELYREATDHRLAGRIPEATTAYEGALVLNSEHEDALYYVGPEHMDWGRSRLDLIQSSLPDGN